MIEAAARCVRWGMFIILLMCFTPLQSYAHDLDYTSVDIKIAPSGEFLMTVHLFTGAYVLELEQSVLSTDQQKKFEALTDGELNSAIAKAAQRFSDTTNLAQNGQFLDSISVAMPSAERIRADTLIETGILRPSAPILARGRLADPQLPIRFAPQAALGNTVLSVSIPDGTIYSQALSPGQWSSKIQLVNTSDSSQSFRTFASFIVSGFRHVIPKGADHILFIVLLALGSDTLGRAAKLSLIFTLAHSITLGWAALLSPPLPLPLVESLIALSILALAIDVWRGKQKSVSYGLVFLFGLLHGLGFAAVFAGLPDTAGRMLISLAGFNIGVEIAQIVVISTASILTFAIAGISDRKKIVVKVCSLAIGTISIYWVVDRVSLDFISF